MNVIIEETNQIEKLPHTADGFVSFSLIGKVAKLDSSVFDEDLALWRIPQADFDRLNKED